MITIDNFRRHLIDSLNNYTDTFAEYLQQLDLFDEENEFSVAIFQISLNIKSLKIEEIRLFIIDSDSDETPTIENALIFDDGDEDFSNISIYLYPKEAGMKDFLKKPQVKKYIESTIMEWVSEKIQDSEGYINNRLDIYVTCNTSAQLLYINNDEYINKPKELKMSSSCDEE